MPDPIRELVECVKGETWKHVRPKCGKRLER